MKHARSQVDQRLLQSGLFVYGTLKPNRANRFARRLKRESAGALPAVVKGSLRRAAGVDQDVGVFPSLSIKGKREVPGLFVLLKTPEKTFSTWLDEYEGAGKDAPERLFRRRRVQVWIADERDPTRKRAIRAWCYVRPQAKG